MTARFDWTEAYHIQNMDTENGRLNTLLTQEEEYGTPMMHSVSRLPGPRRSNCMTK